MLSFLSGTDVFTKYKQLSDEMTLRADITSLEHQKGHFIASRSCVQRFDP